MGVALHGVCYTSAAQAAPVLCSQWKGVDDRAAGKWECVGVQADALVIRRVLNGVTTDYVQPVTGPACDPMTLQAALPREVDNALDLRTVDSRAFLPPAASGVDLQAEASAVLLVIGAAIAWRSVRLVVDRS